MTSVFTPKFVDMVRVNSATQGTGPLVCGSAVTGFASFADVLSAGDSFYYSVQGVDRPQEREVGRGTYQADNSITREPLRGAATNFSAGAKIIALVAASEWYNQMNLAGSRAEKLEPVGSRTALKAITEVVSGDVRRLSEPGRAGEFRWDPAVPVAMHQADTREGIYVAPKPGANGAWVRQFDGPVLVDWFGTVGDDIANDGPAFLAALDFLDQNRADNSSANKLLLGPKRYFLGGSTLNIRTTLIIEGAGRDATRLRWSAGVSGIRIGRVNTPDATSGSVPVGSVGGGDSSTIRHMTLRGPMAAGVNEGEFHGIELRARANLHDLYISHFQGDGIFSRAAAGSAEIEGNANCSQVSQVTIIACRNALYTDSADANAWLVQGCDFTANRQWGVWDSSFLGNTYVAIHTSANGWDGAGGSIPTACTHNGNRYAVVPDQEGWCSANPPTGGTTSNQGWIFLGTGGTYAGVAVWANGTVFRSGGSYRVDDINARNAFVGCYHEGDQNPGNMLGPSLVLGGLMAVRDRQGRPFAGFLDFTTFQREFTVGDGNLRFGQGGVHGQFYAAFGGTVWDTPNPVIRRNGVSVGQGLADGWNAVGKLYVDGTKVLGPRETGWTAATGTGNKGSFVAAAAGTASPTYVPGELQNALARVAAAEGRIVAIEAAMRSHGLIN